jgi:hypothetical protein
MATCYWAVFYGGEASTSRGSLHTSPPCPGWERERPSVRRASRGRFGLTQVLKQWRSGIAARLALEGNSSESSACRARQYPRLDIAMNDLSPSMMLCPVNDSSETFFHLLLGSRNRHAHKTFALSAECRTRNKRHPDFL